MLAAAEHSQHTLRDFHCGRFTENLPIALRHRVACKDQAVIYTPSNISRLLKCQPRNQLGRALPAAGATFSPFACWYNVEIKPGLGQQLSPPRRSACKDQFWIVWRTKRHAMGQSQELFVKAVATHRIDNPARRFRIAIFPVAWITVVELLRAQPIQHLNQDVAKRKLDILYEDNHLLVLNKPAGLPTMGVTADSPSLVTLAKQYIKRRYNKPGNVYLGIVSRLDRLVSGVVVLARTSKAAARLAEQFRSRNVQKIYWAIVEGRVDASNGQLEHWLWHNDAEQRVEVVDPGRPGAKQALLHFRKIRQAGANSLMEVELKSGRKHQIRVQLAASGNPILGDQKYGSQRGFSFGIALHSRSLQFEHPVGRQPLNFLAPLPTSWNMEGVER